MNEHIPKKCFTVKNFVSADLQHDIDEKKKLRRAQIKTKIRCIDKMISDRINENQYRILMNKLKSIKPNHEMFKNINKLLNSGNRSIPALKRSDGTLISNEVDVANAMKKYMSKIGEWVIKSSIRL